MYLGIGKTTFNSSITKLSESDIEIILTERLNREKASGKWPMMSLLNIPPEKIYSIVENRDSSSVTDYENLIDKKSPFYLMLEKKKLQKYSQKFNPDIIEISHHYAHALAAKFMSPFEKCLILVRDGAGSKVRDVKRLVNIDKGHVGSDDNNNEMVSLYSLENGELKCLDKQYQTFSWVGEISVSDGIGILYEAVAEYIFNNKRAAGKVMGLAPFGNYDGEVSKEALLRELASGKQFKGKSKSEWETSSFIDHYKDMASLMQQLFEKESEQYLKKISEDYPDYKNLILTGGTALNCTYNMKLYNSRIFADMYVLPFPGDESISFGCALHEYYKENDFMVISRDVQHGYYGDRGNIPRDMDIKEIFKQFKLTLSESICSMAAEMISHGEVIAWYQGRSESGPRSLGNRSILAPLNKSGLKDYLNSHIKFREDFRPYGASFTHESATRYFQVDEKFFSHFMSYSMPINVKYKTELSEITHVDGTSRAQTVTSGQNELFHNLLKTVENKTGIPGVLNTSLNIMGQPIVESLEDLRDFFKDTKIKYLFVGNYMVEKHD